MNWLIDSFTYCLLIHAYKFYFITLYLQIKCSNIDSSHILTLTKQTNWNTCLDCIKGWEIYVETTSYNKNLHTITLHLQQNIRILWYWLRISFAPSRSDNTVNVIFDIWIFPRLSSKDVYYTIQTVSFETGKCF